MYTSVRFQRAFSLAVASICLATTGMLDARVTKITISSTTPVSNAGSVGPYEQLRGTAIGEIDPNDRRNAVITDLEFAPRNANGMVGYTTQFSILKPVDMSKAAGIMLYNVPNRGNISNPFGTDLLFARGHVVLNSAWQGDQPIASASANSLGIDVPIATGITGPVWDRFVGPSGTTVSLPGPGRDLATMDTTQASLISATSETPAGVKSGVVHIASTDFAFADCRTVPFPGTPDPTRLCLRGGFNNALLYELVRLAKNPFVLGVGEAAMRDVNSFFRYATADDFNTPNPVANRIQHAIGFGSSQSGRLLKHFLNNGFNEDDSGNMGRIVWDGANPNIAGMMGSFNIRFAKPGDIAELYDPGADGPLWWSDYTDTVRGHPAWGLLHRCNMTNTCPKIMETYGVQPGISRHRRDDRCGRPSGASQCPSLLSRGDGAWRGRWRLEPRHQVNQSEHACQQPQSAKGDKPCALCRTCRLGGERDLASAERLSARERQYAGPGDLRGDGLAEYSGHAEA